MLAICLDPQHGPVAEALRRLPELDLTQFVEPFPGLNIEDEIPGLTPRGGTARCASYSTRP